MRGEHLARRDRGVPWAAQDLQEGVAKQVTLEMRDPRLVDYQALCIIAMHIISSLCQTYSYNIYPSWYLCRVMMELLGIQEPEEAMAMW